MDLQRYSKIDKKTRTLIDAFIRPIKQLFDTNNAYYDIPSCINQLCALFYMYPFDKWDIDAISDRFVIDGDVLSYEKTSIYGAATAFMSNIIEHGKYEWKFRLNKYDGTGVIIGVWNINDQPKIDDALNTWIGRDKNTSSYVYDWRNTQINNDGIHEKIPIRAMKGYGQRPKKGSVIEMCLDLNVGSLSFKIDGEDYGVAYDNIKPSKYRAALSSWQGNDIQYLHD